MRCLGPAAIEVDVEAREVDQRGAEDEELKSPYVDEEVLNVGALAHDALALALPQQLLCREDCAGPVRGLRRVAQRRRGRRTRPSSGARPALREAP